MACDNVNLHFQKSIAIGGPARIEFRRDTFGAGLGLFWLHGSDSKVFSSILERAAAEKRSRDIYQGVCGTNRWEGTTCDNNKTDMRWTWESSIYIDSDEAVRLLGHKLCMNLGLVPTPWTSPAAKSVDSRRFHGSSEDSWVQIMGDDEAIGRIVVNFPTEDGISLT